jgi:hypothetical protein
MPQKEACANHIIGREIIQYGGSTQIVTSLINAGHQARLK